MNNENMMRERLSNQSEVNIFTQFLLKVRSLWYVVAICFLVGSLVGVMYYSVLSKPKYQSTAMVYLRSSSKKISLESLQLNTSLTKDYQIIFTSRPNLEGVIKKLNLKYTVNQLDNMISIDNPDQTRILQITVTSLNPKEAKQIANAVIDFGMDDIREIDSQEPFIVEKGVINNQRIGMGLFKTIVVYGFLGLLICLAVITTKFLLNDSFTSSEDVESSLGIPVLAIIAEDTSLNYAKLETTNSRRRKHHGKKTSK